MQPATFARGWELHQAGDLRAAEEIYRGVLRAEPRNGKIWFALAQLCQTDQRLVEAVACVRQALEVEPADADRCFLLGNLLLQQGQPKDAESAYRDCLKLRRDHPLALGNLGFVLAELDHLDEAKACYEQALKIRPDLAEVHHNLGNVLREQGQLDAALACYQTALQRRPEYAKAFINRGIALVAMGRIDDAIRDLQHGVQLKPDLADAHISLGAALCVQQRFEEATDHYQQALALMPDHAEAAWNQSLLWLLQGDYERGWPAYEARWRCKRTTPLPTFEQPRWDGSPLDGRTILLHGEQGLGDTLHFVRYAPMVKARGGRVIVHCQNALCRLLARSPGIDGLVGWGATPPKFDVWLPLMSLPTVFHTTLDTIPASIPYVSADPALVMHWRRELAPVRGLRVGIAWQGSPRHAWDRHRSVSLEHFEPLAKIAGIHLISLQKNLGSEQLRALQGRVPVLSLGDLVDEASGPFMDTAAIIANLDLVVSIDTAVAHLAGAMGKPVWLALTFTPDWRWLLGRADNLWYPSARLFRQPSLGDWPSVFRQIADSVAIMAASHSVHRPIYLETSPAELLDRIALLEVQNEKTQDATERQKMNAELADLTTMRLEAVPAIAELSELVAQLKSAHGRIRELSAEIRQCEATQEFGSRFVKLSRAFYQESENRVKLRQAINRALNYTGIQR